MWMIEPVQEVTRRLEEAIRAVEAYRDVLRADVENVHARTNVGPKVTKVWEWQLLAAEDLLKQLDGAVWDQLQRIVEQDFVLRQPNVDQILI